MRKILKILLSNKILSKNVYNIRNIFHMIISINQCKLGVSLFQKINILYLNSHTQLHLVTFLFFLYGEVIEETVAIK